MKRRRVGSLSELEKLYADLNEAYSARFRNNGLIIELCDELLSFPVELLQVPWRSRAWQGEVQRYPSEYTLKHGLLETLVTAGVEAGEESVVIRATSELLEDASFLKECAPLMLCYRLSSLFDSNDRSAAIEVKNIMSQMEPFAVIDIQKLEMLSEWWVVKARAAWISNCASEAYQWSKRALKIMELSEEKPHASFEFHAQLIACLSMPLKNNWLENWKFLLGCVWNLNLNIFAHREFLSHITKIWSSLSPRESKSVIELVETVCDRLESFGFRSSFNSYKSYCPYLAEAKGLLSLITPSEGVWDVVIEAGVLGNSARFANHADIPNGALVARELKDPRNSKKFTVRMLTAISDIQPGEEILVNYGGAYWDNLGPPSSSENEEMIDFDGVIDASGRERLHPALLRASAVGHEFSVKSDTSNVEVVDCPLGHPAYPGKMLIARRNFQVGSSICSYGGLLYRLPRECPDFSDGRHTLLVNQRVVGAYGFLLEETTWKFLERQPDLPVIAAALNSRAGELGGGLVDLSNIKYIGGLNSSNTKSLIAMLQKNDKELHATIKEIKLTLTARGDLLKKNQKISKLLLRPATPSEEQPVTATHSEELPHSEERHLPESQIVAKSSKCFETSEASTSPSITSNFEVIDLIEEEFDGALIINNIWYID